MANTKMVIIPFTLAEIITELPYFGKITASKQPKTDLFLIINYLKSDMENGGWTVILNRIPDNDDEDDLKNNNNHHDFFNRNLGEYERGFGHARDNFWLGLSHIHSILSKSTKTELRVNGGNGHIASTISKGSKMKHGAHGHHQRNHASYKSFTMGDASTGYEIRLGEKYEGDLVDVSRPMSGRVFSTRDNDQTDNDCPDENKSGWWFDAEKCWNKGMCLTCKHRHYYTQGDGDTSDSYDDYEYIQMAIKSFRV